MPLRLIGARNYSRAVNLGWGTEAGVAFGCLMLAYGLIKFTMAWLRADDKERARWRYRGRHDGGGPVMPPDPAHQKTWHGEHRDADQ